ncbi:MAG: 3-methyl-2-oxobutanoate hydroxymethyltransferase [Planctomycetota bacterium]|nr:3-methyl-2-oxobutanoate hydroxymethyltransferase [Planctomycetota bacterium]
MGSPRKVTTASLRRMRSEGHKIVVLTAYDHTFATLLDEAGVDVLLVGDSVATVVQGEDTTVPVTLDEMVYHSKLVARAARRALVVADLPFLSYQISEEEALRNAGRLMKEARVEAVKLEGGAPVADCVRRLTDAGIPVMGHLGLTPQSIHAFGGYAVRGRAEEGERLIEDARRLVEAGIFALVLEKIPADLAARVTAEIPVPTIGIGAGPHCSGQVLVSYDMLGLFERFRPRFVRRYAELGDTIREAARRFGDDVRAGAFPSREESYDLDAPSGTG